MNRHLFLIALAIVVAAIAGHMGENAATEPSSVKMGAAAEVVLQRAGDGHFYADVDVNGAAVRMMADTGASAVVLSAEDAERAGIDVDQLDFSRQVTTGNGRVTVAEVLIDEVRIGSIVRRDVRAIVVPKLSASLLGMSFFNSLSKVAMESDELVLRD
jgi:aspartyl protease family protein